MSNATTMYQLSLSEAKSLLRVSQGRTVLLQGHMGTGKSSMLKMLGDEMPSHTTCYFDCTTKDLGDITLPRIEKLDEKGYVTYVTNEELGAHLAKPIILMIDEYGKANPSVKNALLRLMLERKIGSYTLHKDSIVFATTNLGSEGVGDLLPAHARNRLTLVKTRKPTTQEWIEDYAIEAGIDHTLIAWVHENPQLMASFEDIRDPADNKFIFHPADPSRVSFVTPRSLEAASGWLSQREHISDKTLTAALIGAIGTEGASNLSAFVRIADQLPTLDSIKADPMHAKVPTSASAVMMVVYRTLSTIDKTWMDSWMDYMNRLDKEAQTMFAMNVRRPTYGKQGEVMTNKKFTAWCLANNYVFVADKQ